MQRLHTFVLNKIFKSSILPILLIEVLLIILIFVLGFWQEEKNETLVQQTAAASFEEVAKQVTARLSAKIEGVEKDATALKLMLESLYQSPEKVSLEEEYRFSEGFFIREENALATVYTTNLTELTPMDRINLRYLSHMESPLHALMQQHQGVVESAWINLGKHYSLFYPAIEVEKELSADLDPTTQAYYFKADAQHNPEKKTIFIPHFQESWALELGQIGSVVAPIYDGDTLKGVLGMTLSVQNTQMISGIQLPFDAYIILLDKEGHVLFSSKEDAFYKDFGINTFSALYRQKRMENLQKFHIEKLEQKQYIYFQRMLQHTGLELLLISKQDSINHEINKVYFQTRQYGVIALIVIVLIHLGLFWYIRRRVKSVSDVITQPIGEVAKVSESLLQEAPLNLNESRIYEVDVLQKNMHLAHAKLLEQLYYDGQTRLPNLVKLHQDIKEGSTLILVSVDNYKMLKNIYGLEVAHAVLEKLVEILLSFPRTPMRLYRIYNDTFALLSDTKVHLQEELKYLYDRLSLERIPLDAFDIALNYSLSLALPSMQSKLPLFARAEIALYKAREQEHRKYLLFDENRNDEGIFAQNQEWSKRFQTALHEHRIVAFFQPIYNIQEGCVNKFESLVRMIEGDEVILPYHFLHIAKQLGKLSDITLLMLKEVFEQVKKFPDVEFSINTSFEDFEEANLLHDIKKMIEHEVVNTRNIIIEILETGTYKDEQYVIDTIKALKALGFKIAIDDFGAGNSNFAHLMLMQVDYIKIDGQFVRNIIEDVQSQNITQTINRFGHLAGAKTVAEFVADEAIFEMISKMGIDYAQGYYICEPREASQIDQMLSIKELGAP